MQRIPVTVEGAIALREELDYRKSELRPKIVNDLATARAHGDLKENAEYAAAREQQSFNEGRIQEIESKLSLAQIIDITKMNNTGKIIFGATVTIVNSETDVSVTYKIVGDDEADLKLGKISVSSPIARALIGKSLGDEVEVIAPSGVIIYEVTDVKYI